MTSFLVSSGHRFYYSNALSDWMAITNEKAANPCSYFEIQQGECMEYYGMRRGRYICKDYYDDFLECRFQFKQVRKLFFVSNTVFNTLWYFSFYRNWEPLLCRQREGNDTENIWPGNANGIRYTLNPKCQELGEIQDLILEISLEPSLTRIKMDFIQNCL